MPARMTSAMATLLCVDLMLISFSRFRILIYLLTVQGIMIGAMPFLLRDAPHSLFGYGLMVLSLGLRGVVFPWLLLVASRKIKLLQQGDCVLPHATAMALGMGLIMYCVWLGSRLSLPVPPMSSLMLPAALATILMGLMLIVTRRHALSQVLGYVVLENGISLLGISLHVEEEVLVELGTLLDVFVGVFVMGVMIYHIRQEFDALDMDQLSELRE